MTRTRKDEIRLPIYKRRRQIKPREALSARELEVVRLVSCAYPNAEIARELGICVQTVKRHVYNIFDKTGMSNRVELALWGRKHG